jgi:hypothetical protein
MKALELPLPLLASVAVTRGMLGMGAGLLLAPSLPDDRRRVIGWTLLAVGILSTIPLAADVLSRNREHR